MRWLEDEGPFQCKPGDDTCDGCRELAYISLTKFSRRPAEEEVEAEEKVEGLTALLTQLSPEVSESSVRAASSWCLAQALKAITQVAYIRDDGKVESFVNSIPNLKDDQRQRLRILLRGETEGGVGASVLNGRTPWPSDDHHPSMVASTSPPPSPPPSPPDSGKVKGQDIRKRSVSSSSLFADDLEVPDPYIRQLTGWFRDMSFYMNPNPTVGEEPVYWGGFNVINVLQYPRLSFDKDYRFRVVGLFDKIGGADPGFVTMCALQAVAEPAQMPPCQHAPRAHGFCQMVPRSAFRSAVRRWLLSLLPRHCHRAGHLLRSLDRRARAHPIAPPGPGHRAGIALLRGVVGRVHGRCEHDPRV